MNNQLRRVLLVCYYFPPLGGAGINRPLQLHRKLPEFGFECDILTVKPVTYRVYEPELIPQQQIGRVYRSGSRDPQRLMYLLGKRNVGAQSIEQARQVSDRFFPDPKVGWVRPAVSLGHTIVENRRYEAIVSTSPPISSHLVAMRLSDEFSLPWIADFRDLWTARPIEHSYRSARMREKAHDLMLKIRSEAHTIVAVNQSVADYVGGRHVIPNAWHEQIARLWSVPSNSDRITIGVLGTLNELYPIEPLLRIIRRLRETDRELFDRLHIMHVGSSDAIELDSLIGRYDLEAKVTQLGRLDRHATIERLSEASLFYVSTSPDDGAAFSTGRIFTLLPSGRPILAYAHGKGELARLVAETERGFVFDDTTEADALNWLGGQCRSIVEGEFACQLMPAYAEPYSETALARSYASLLRSVLRVSG